MMRELTAVQMAQVNGGYAVDGRNGKFYSVDDNDGFIYTECNINIQYAQWAAEMRDQSRFVITPEEYQRKFGKPLF